MTVNIVPVHEHLGLADYEELPHLSQAVHELRSHADLVRPILSDRKLWMVNSTAAGGGVAEMLPKMVTLLRELGVDTEWLVIDSDLAEFFVLTKKIHNLIHGAGEPSLGAADRELYEAVSRQNAVELENFIRPQDVLVIHDPQPLGSGALVKEKLAPLTLWRCHIGLDQVTAATRAVWSFLEPFATVYDHAVFSAPEYIPSFLSGKSTVISPAIDPLSHKNRELSAHKLTGVLCNGSLAVPHAPVLTPTWDRLAQRLHHDGHWIPAGSNDEIGLLFRPTVVQISRWDRLKGFAPLLEAFVRLKRGMERRRDGKRHGRRLEILRLILAGPDPSSIVDDPEGQIVLQDLVRRYLELEPEMQRDVALLTLPMESRKENALMVNALQRCATVVVQNSLQEGFGLTVAEAMWKRSAVVGSSACGIRQQIRDGLDGRLVGSAEDVTELEGVLNEVLADPGSRDVLGRMAQRRVYKNFLIFSQVESWLSTLDACLKQTRASG